LDFALVLRQSPRLPASTGKLGGLVFMTLDGYDRVNPKGYTRSLLSTGEKHRQFHRPKVVETGRTMTAKAHLASRQVRFLSCRKTYASFGFSNGTVTARAGTTVEIACL
jgi:hypothetical protein